MAVLSCAGPAGSVVAPGADGNGPGAFVFASAQWTAASVDKRIFCAERSCDRIGLQRSTHQRRWQHHRRPGADEIGPEADLLTTHRRTQPGGPSGGPPPGGAALGALATRRWSSVRTIRAATADAK
jgi:hypothetical protein